MYFLQHRLLRIILLASIGTWLILGIYQRFATNQPFLADRLYAQSIPQAATAVETTTTVSETATLTPTLTLTPSPTHTTPPTPTATWTPIWVTPTPVAIDLFAAATLSAQMTADATTTGTATPLPVNWKVSTVRVLPYVPEPENQATVDALALEATARAFTTGEPTGVIYWTATPRPTNTPLPTNTTLPTPTATWTVVWVTPTAPAIDLFAAATLSAQMTADATTNGTATPLPANWKVAIVRVLPYVPEPENQATADALAVEATARAVTTGEPTGVINWTATPRPTNTPLPTNTALPTPTATWTAIWVTPTAPAIDLFAAATLSAQMTADATTNGTATPPPANWKVSTVRVLPYVPEPENQATVDALALEATARAVTTGEPIGVIYWTATPRPTNTLVPTPTSTNTPFVITATPAPADVLIAATLAAQATLDATTTGTATPLPKGVVLATSTPRPIVVTNTATPENAATAAIMIAKETAIAFTTGTPDPARYITATPINTIAPTNTAAPAAGATTRPTNTATPLFIALNDLTATPTPNATPLFPTSFVSKIFFLADMDGRSGPEAYVMDPDGTNVVRLTSMEFYRRAADRDSSSADLRYSAFVRKEMSGSRERQIFANDAFYNSEDQITYFGAGIAWDPAWSPTAERVVFVSNESGNDEIWVANKGEWPATQLTKNEWAWDKHPSWSPDGGQIVFMSNRNGTQQIWLMQADGSNQQQLTNFTFAAWDPVWVKYSDQ